jgi:hypothetical protein
VLTYYKEGTKVSSFQTREADRYNSALLIHGNDLSNPESMQAMLAASERLARAAKDCIRRHSDISPVPDLAAEDYIAWSQVYMDYSAWADAQNDVFVALSQGYTPIAARVQQLMTAVENQRKVAERASKGLLQRARFNVNELAQMLKTSQEEIYEAS